MHDADADRFAARRARVLKELGGDAALVLAAAPEIYVGDTELRYTPDPEIYYLTGFAEPEAVVVLCPSHDRAPFTMFVRARDERVERWTGERAGPEGAVSRFRADVAHRVDQLARKLPKIVSGASRLYARLGAGRPGFEACIVDLLAKVRVTRRRAGTGPHTLVDPGLLLDDMRLIKDQAEIAAIRNAVEITVATFREVARGVEPGAGEWALEAALEAGFRRRGATGPAFPSIVASGPNAAVLHYIANRREALAGELVLIDAGARHGMYCADVSRTYAVSKRAKREQRTLHDTVRAARDAAIAAIKPGEPADAPHQAALAVLLEGLHELGYVDDEPRKARRRRKQWTAFYPHKTCHWLGLEVHDAGDYVRHGKARPLQPGMVLTVEPGLYIPADTDRGPATLRGTGVRIEDDVLVTADGHEVLSADLDDDILTR